MESGLETKMFKNKTKFPVIVPIQNKITSKHWSEILYSKFDSILLTPRDSDTNARRNLLTLESHDLTILLS